MIAPMLKYSFLVFHADYDTFLRGVRDLGVAHLVEKHSGVSEELRDQYDQLKQIQDVVKQLLLREVAVTEQYEQTEGKVRYEEVRQLFEKIEVKKQQRTQLQKEINQVRHWGDFSPAIIEKLAAEGLTLKFYAVATKKFKEPWLQEFPIDIIEQQGGITYFIMLVQDREEVAVDAEEIKAPERPLSELLHYREEIERDLKASEEKLDWHAGHSLQAIRQHYLALKQDLDFVHALKNTTPEADDTIMLLEGWVPVAHQSGLISYLDKNQVLFIVEEPAKGEKVPVLLKNQSFSNKFEMLGELYSLPKYQELDLTPFFAPFYLLFFGFCLGDAGYGILMVLASLLLKKRVKKELKTVLGLVFYLGLSTILFGIIGGTLFGIPLYETGIPIYSNLAQHFADRGTDINQLLFYLALIFGGVQILFGMLIKLANEVKQYGWGYALGTLGWITLLLGGTILYLTGLIIDQTLDQMRIPFYALLIVSGILILPLNNARRNIFKNIGLGLWTSYNMVTGILGDLLSYIRLFALGISSAIMGFVFNSLAVEMSGSIPVLSVLIMVIILVIGHAINLFMSGLGAFVHPMRLTFVEFYKNAGFSGGGKKYNPFRTIT